MELAAEAPQRPDYENYPFNPLAEQIVEKICNKIGNSSPMFFRITVNYHLTKMPSMMRIDIKTKDRGIIPINMYAVNLAPSGYGKGYCTNIMEQQLMHRFKSAFFDQTLPLVEEENLAKLATKRADIKGTDPDAEMKIVKTEYKAQGELLFAFSEATKAAVGQCCSKLKMAGIGSANLEIDEIGRNISGNQEAMTLMLELFDVGQSKQKLIKHGKDNKHIGDLEGPTPANQMLYGAPSALFDGGKIEDDFYAYMDTGGARRPFIGYATDAGRDLEATAEEILAKRTDTSQDQFMDALSLRFESLASQVNYGKTVSMSTDVTLELIEYQIHCEREAAKLSNLGHEDTAKAELSHRYFKALKLAGAYAFIDECSEITSEHLHNAIRMAEESGKAFNLIKNREPNYVKLARYIADVGYELTHAQMSETLPFYKGAKAVREEMITYAVAWGYKNSVIIKRNNVNGIDFFQGETLKPTDLDHMFLAYSKHEAYDYKNVKAPFADIYKLTQAPDLHWVNHHMATGHRKEENVKQGFNMLVLDVDGGCTLAFAEQMLHEYQGLIYTTKRHTAKDNRFRVILPLNYELKLNKEDYREFVDNIIDWLPFDVDKASNQRSKKWLSHPGQYTYLPGEKLVDAMEFIPRTSRNDQRKKDLSEQSLTNIERWFVNNTADGNRSKQMIRYAFMLIDQGKDFEEIRSAVYGLNSKLQDKLTENEIRQTILVSTHKALQKRNP